MITKKEYVTINGKSFGATNRGFNEFLAIRHKGENYKLFSVEGPQEKAIDLIYAIHNYNFEDIQIKGIRDEMVVDIPLNKNNCNVIFEMLLYMWYLKFGKNERVLLGNQEVSSERVDNRVFIKDNVYFYFHKIDTDKTEFETIKDIMDEKYTRVVGISLNHEKAKAKFTTLSRREYLYRNVGAYLMDDLKISPSFIFDKDEIHKYSLEQLQLYSQYSNYNDELKFSNKEQPSLKDLHAPLKVTPPTTIK